MVAAVLVSGAALAQHADIANTSSDGPGKDVQTLLRNMGITSDVQRDQVTGRVFRRSDPNQAVSLYSLFSVAAYKDAHKLGFYQPVGTNSPITWHIGGADTHLPDHKNVNINGNFGVALHSPEGDFRSERALNEDNFEHFAVVKLKYATNDYVPHTYLILMEDLRGGGDRDFNDRAIVICNVDLVPVPEPATMLVLGGGLATVLRRRRRN